jgi:phospholipase/carboxylesterase
MNPIPTTLIHKLLQPRRRSADPAPLLILLHGRGANEEDLLGLAEYLDERLFIVSPRAPYAFQFGGGYTWYDMEELAKPEPEMFRASLAKIRQFVEDVGMGYPVDRTRVFLGGFSMGTILSYAVALTEPARVRGVIATSGYVPEETELRFAWDGVKGMPFFVTHGTYDPVIPVSFGRRAKELLEKAGATLTYREYDMGHQISEESLNDMMTWVSAQLGRPRG